MQPHYLGKINEMICSNVVQGNMHFKKRVKEIYR
jgi:hypothetical protein